jgi:hypothetical protein
MEIAALNPKPKLIDYASIHDLSLEILMLVFEHCLPPDCFIQRSASQSPRLLCQISHTWREVAIHTHSQVGKHSGLH